MIEIMVRKLSKHPSYKKEEVPCILIAGKKLVKKYGWKVGDSVRVDLNDDGVRIYKINKEEQERQDEIQEDTTDLEEKVEELEKPTGKEKQNVKEAKKVVEYALKGDGAIIAGDESKK